MTRRQRTLASIAVASVAALSTLPPKVDAQAGNSRRQASRDHYSGPAAVSPAPLNDAVDAQRFPLEKWGDLYAWRLLQPYYVTAVPAAFTPLAPPANSSAQTRAELDYLLSLQESRIEEEQKWADHLAGVYYHPLVANPAAPRFIQNRDNLFFVGRRLGAWFARGAMPKTTGLLARVSHDAMIQVVELKLKYARPRPHHLEPRLKATDAKIPHGSYPSGHSFLSYRPLPSGSDPGLTRNGWRCGDGVRPRSDPGGQAPRDGVRPRSDPDRPQPRTAPPQIAQIFRLFSTVRRLL